MTNEEGEESGSHHVYPQIKRKEKNISIGAAQTTPASLFFSFLWLISVLMLSTLQHVQRASHENTITGVAESCPATATTKRTINLRIKQVLLDSTL